MNLGKLITRRIYEWDIEHVDEHGDVIDHSFYDHCPGLPLDDNLRLVLVCDEVRGYSNAFDDTADLVDRQWANVENGELPERFSHGRRVPAAYRRELRNVTRSPLGRWARTLRDIEEHPWVQSTHLENDGCFSDRLGRPIPGRWVYLREGFICEPMECGTIHERSVADCCAMLNQSRRMTPAEIRAAYTAPLSKQIIARHRQELKQ